jgi:hypothetical protein
MYKKREGVLAWIGDAMHCESGDGGKLPSLPNVDVIVVIATRV